MDVKIYTDGAARGNPDGPGGYGTVIQFIDGKGTLHEREFSQGYNKTTNNRMELSAVIAALSALTEPCEVTLTSDSKYVVDAVGKGWVYGWKKRGWKKSDNSPALNSDLWEKLLPLLSKHKVTFVWIKGHAGHPENERCDELAVAAAERNR